MEQQTNEEILYHDFNYICDQIYRLIVEGKDMEVSLKEMFGFLETISLILKERSDMSKIDKGLESTILSNGRTVGEQLRSLNKDMLLSKLIKLDHLEDLRRLKNKKKRVKNH